MAAVGTATPLSPFRPLPPNRDVTGRVELVQFQDLTDRLPDVLRKLTGIRIQQQYNIMLQNGWTLGSAQLLKVLQLTIRIFHGPMVRLLEEFWRETSRGSARFCNPAFQS